jgi:hypothetical protein
MDGALASNSYSTVSVIKSKCDTLTSKKDVAVALKELDVSPSGAAASADLGGSSNYYIENI